MKTTAEKKFLPYGRQTISEEDIAAVAEVLRSDWLTQGPQVERFESKLAAYLGCRHVVACTSGTAALHLAMLALELGRNDAIVTSTVTFLASANCARYVGADALFVDIDPNTGLIDMDSLEAVIEQDEGKTIRAIVPVHFAGQPSDLPRIKFIAEKYGIKIVDDACHALGSSFSNGSQAVRVGGNDYADMTVFSFHPVKHVACGEGGAVATDDDALAAKLRLYRNHGMQRDSFALPDLAYAPDGSVNPWYYEMQRLGFNYRLTDIQAVLGGSQLDRLESSIKRRQGIANLYRSVITQTFSSDQVSCLMCHESVSHAYHLFVLQIDYETFNIDRATVMNRLKDEKIGTQVHYLPIPYQPYYRERSSRHCGFPGADKYYRRALSIPMYPALTDDDCHRVVETLKMVLSGGV